ncbi:MAG: cell division protein FtsB [Gammaproteobacteria bacterium]|nr:cell division protein FtsB [Gammaproteobacteria bacterium]
MKKLFALSVVLLLWLQYTLWFGQSGYFARERLDTQLSQQQGRLGVLKYRNQILTAQVLALKANPKMLEAQARRDLGMVKRGEVFYLVPDHQL